MAHPSLDGGEGDAGGCAAGADAVAEAVEREARQLVALRCGGLEDGVAGCRIGAAER